MTIILKRGKKALKLTIEEVEVIIKQKRKKRKLNLRPEERERRRQLMLDLGLWEMSHKMLLASKRPIFNFDYLKLWHIFEAKNEEALEQENDVISLVQFLLENRVFFSRGRGIFNKEQRKLIQKLVRELEFQSRRALNYGLTGILLGLEYRALAKLMLYGWLTILRRTYSNYVSNIANMPSTSLSEMFCFHLEDEMAILEAYEIVEIEWIKGQAEERKKRQIGAVANLLDVSEANAEQEITSMK